MICTVKKSKLFFVEVIVTFSLLTASCGFRSAGESSSGKQIEGIAAARMATTYLNDVRKLAMQGLPDPTEFDRKWRWAWQEADRAKQSGIDQDIVDDLYCSLSAFAGFAAVGRGLVEADRCLSNAESALRQRYGK